MFRAPPRARCRAQWKLRNKERAVSAIDFTMTAKEEPGEKRIFTLMMNVSKGARVRAGASMFTPLVAFTCFPNEECVKAILHALRGAEEYYCGSVAHQGLWIMDAARELNNAVCEVFNKCSLGETLRRCREAIKLGKRPTDTLTLPSRDKYHHTASTKFWTITRMVVLEGGPSRAFFTRLAFRIILPLWDAGRPGARLGELKGVPLTAEEHKADRYSGERLASLARSAARGRLRARARAPPPP